jgi:hypothetical protein
MTSADVAVASAGPASPAGLVAEGIEALLAGVPTEPDHWHASAVTLPAAT